MTIVALIIKFERSKNISEKDLLYLLSNADIAVPLFAVDCVIAVVFDDAVVVIADVAVVEVVVYVVVLDVAVVEAAVVGIAVVVAVDFIANMQHNIIRKPLKTFIFVILIC